MNVHDTLMLAADRLESNGWWGSRGDADLDAVDAACASNTIFRLHAREQLMDAREMFEAQVHLSEYLGGDGKLRVIWRWNDAPDQTKVNVVATMRAAAATSLAKDAAVAAREHAAEGVSAS